MRWAPEYDRHSLSTRMLYEFGREMNIPYIIRRHCLYMRQWVLSVFGEGIVEYTHHKDVQDDYIHILNILEDRLSKVKYLGGSAPNIVDFGFSGSMFRHFSSDPTPSTYIYICIYVYICLYI